MRFDPDAKPDLQMCSTNSVPTSQSPCGAEASEANVACSWDHVAGRRSVPSWEALPPGRNLNNDNSLSWTFFKSSHPGAMLTFASPWPHASHSAVISDASHNSCFFPSSQTRKGSLRCEARDPGTVANVEGEDAQGSVEPSVFPSLRAPRSSGSDSRSLDELTPSNSADGDLPRPPTSALGIPFPA